MYYAAKDPVPQQGESIPGEFNELPVIAAQPLSEATPQFKSFQIRNVRCKGVETVILIRGLPEMAVKNILIENAVLQSRKGFVCIEADNIRLKNVVLISPAKTRHGSPLLQIRNSHNLTLDTIRYADNIDLLIYIAGDRSKDNKLLNTNTSNAKKTVETTTDVPANVLTMN